MPWYIIEAERKTWTKYVIEAADEAEAYERSGTEAEEYLGYLDGPNETSRTHGPFASRDEALADETARVDGR